MDSILACCRSRKPNHGEQEPLLPQHETNTVLQRQLQDKLHGYEMVRAAYSGFMPSTDQIVAHLRALLVSDLLNPDNPTLSSKGRLLVQDLKVWIRAFIEVLCTKNGEDQIQEIIWNLSRSRASVDVPGLVQTAAMSKARADSAAGMWRPPCDAS